MPDPRDSPFARLADRELDRAYRLAGLLLSNQEEAQDATQDAMLRAWSAAGSLRNPDDFQAWFDRILVNVCRDRLRRRRLVQFVAINDETAVRPAPDPFADVFADDELNRAMTGLDAELRAIVVLRFWADLSVDEIARRTGSRPGTIKSRLHRALGVIRGNLGTQAAQDAAR